MFQDKILVSQEEYNYIINNQNEYVFMNISECTEKALEDKCEFILKNQNLSWKPLLQEHKYFVNVYIRRFYYKK